MNSIKDDDDTIDDGQQQQDGIINSICFLFHFDCISGESGAGGEGGLGS
jgi:hypothetical protein